MAKVGKYKDDDDVNQLMERHRSIWQTDTTVHSKYLFKQWNAFS